MSENIKKTEQAEKLAEDILKMSRNSLLMNMRFLDSAVFRLENKIADIPSYATDGKYLYYNIKHIFRQYKKDKKQVCYDYFHIIMHCIFRHFFVESMENPDYWNLASDIAVASIINNMGLDCISTENFSAQQNYIKELKKEVKFLSAEKIYNHFLKTNLSIKKLAELQKIFYVDDHLAWHGDDEDLQDKENDNNNNNNNQSKKNTEKEWKDASERIQIDIEAFSRKHGNSVGNMLQMLSDVNRERYDYSSFLKKFSVMGETMKINDDEFDYIFYTYGMKLYEKMPLVEPLEYKETKKIKEFVIAIDTSGSVAGELVQKFINKTYNILKSTESFFSKINLHIIQCDVTIQEDVKITSQQEFDNYIENMQLKGFGGTDFRPVFDYVNKLIAKKEFTNLKGLIYFTDGYGVFPERKPDYDTAFIFIRDEFENPKVPPWAIKLVLDENEI